jgi:hypothetical protein
MKRLRPAAAGLVLTFVFACPAWAATAPRPDSDADAAAAAVDLGSPAAELRVDLDRLLAEHAFLTIEQMRSGLVGGPDFADAAVAVEGNTVEIVDAIGSVYGAAAEDPFGEIWRSHIGYLVDYARALGRGDSAGQSTAEAGLAIYRQNLARFLADANPGIDLRQIVEALDMHTAQLLEFIRAEHKGDHSAAYALERQAYPHMFEVGDALARLIANKFPERFTGIDVAYSAAGTLRVMLDRLLAEHAFLAAEAMRSGISGAADFEAAKEAIDGNSADLQAVVGAAYGAGAAASFRQLWDGHISAYVAFIGAARATDASGRAQSTIQVDTYAAQLAGFLAGANHYLDAQALSSMFQQHAHHLISQVEAFAAGDYERTYSLVREGYRHMFMVGESLATGIATQLPKKFPAHAAVPDTATGPMGTTHRERGFPIALILIVAAIAGVLTCVRDRDSGVRLRR